MTHGLTTAKGKLKLSQAKARVRELEDLLHIMGIRDGARWAGQKPTGYRPIDDVETYTFKDPFTDD
jgi:hypothetical protein